MIRQYHTNRAFFDLLFNMLAGFVVLFIIAWIMINIETEKKNVESKAEFLIVVSWPDGMEDDVDTYVEDPADNLVFFGRREQGLMHLDRDDLGNANDIIYTDYGEIEFEGNREVVSIRGIVPGEYVVNVHMYSKKNIEPAEVTVEVHKVNPFSIVAIKKVTLSESKEEKTALRFSIDEKGKVTDVNYLDKSLIEKHLQNRSGSGYNEEPHGN